MKILFIIDNLDSGGAERQCVELCKSFAEKGHCVNIVGYCDGSFYLPEVEKAGISYWNIAEPNPIKRILKIRKLLRKSRPDKVFAFMQTPALLAEFGSLPSHSWRLIVSERSFIGDSPSLRCKLTLQMHRFADVVTTNSYRNAAQITKICPALRSKISTIYNIIDLKKFVPAPNISSRHTQLKLIVVATHHDNKNAAGLLRALSLLSPDIRPVVNWFGRKRSTSPPYSYYPSYLNSDLLRSQYHLEHYVHFFDECLDIIPHYQDADALICPSFLEGLPNVVCEAMACGLPILMGRSVSDSTVLIKDGESGLLFDPHDARSIANILRQFISLPLPERVRMGQLSRQQAEKLFLKENICNAYLNF